jgi:hypothetical protein
LGVKRMAASISARLTILVACSCLGACARSACSSGGSEPTCCARPVRIVRASEFTSLAYRVLEEVKATCPPLNPKRCDDTLRKSACELGGDVVVYRTRMLIGRRGAAQRTDEALIVRFMPRPPRAGEVR